MSARMTGCYNDGIAAIPIGPFVRFLIAAAAAAWTNWDQLSGIFDRKEEVATEPIFGYRMTAVFEMKNAAGAFTSRERGQWSMHYINSTGGDLDTTWEAADFAEIEGNWTYFFTQESAHIPQEVKLVEFRWYAFGPGVVPPNPPVRVTDVTAGGYVGTRSDPWFHQQATTVTLRTSLRRHWGRVYLPWLNTTGFAGGQFGQTQTDALVAAIGSAIDAGNSSKGIFPVVYDRVRKSVLGVTELEVDSVPDVIRRRRPRDTRAHSFYPAP